MSNSKKSEESFFSNQTISSRIKASIVSEYFPQYAKIIGSYNSNCCVRYVDLFAGKGVYDDGNDSTPILIAKACANDCFLKNRVRLILNDNVHCEELKINFERRGLIEPFSKKPFFGNKTVGEEPSITHFLTKCTHEGGAHNKGYNNSPSLLFIDPFGYKGIETKVIAEFLKNWGNEAFIFVNTKRINPALSNNKFENLMEDLFPISLSMVKEEIKKYATVPERLNTIIKLLGEEYKKLLGGRVYYTPVPNKLK